jgi:hypothetical protein
MELLGDNGAKRITDADNVRLNGLYSAANERAGVAEKEAGKANERASKFELAAKQLEAQMAETRTNLANLDRTKPINSAFAIVSFKVSLGFSPLASRQYHPFLTATNPLVGELSFFSSTHITKNKLFFDSERIEEETIDLPVLWNGVMQFHLDRVEVSNGVIENGRLIWTGYPNLALERLSSAQFFALRPKVGIIDDFDSVSLKLFVRPTAAVITDCSAVLFLNSTPKIFSLKLQNPSEYPLVFSGFSK